MTTKALIDVLIVEDNQGDFFLVSDYLASSTQKFIVTNTKTLSETRKILTTKNFDVILLDLSLADSVDVDSVKTIVEYNELTPVIVLTGFGNLEYAIKSLKNGAEDYLVKDEINLNLLEKSINYSIERNRLKYENVKKDRLFRVITENSLDAKIILDKNCKILFCTSSVDKLLGLDSFQCVGKDERDILHSDYISLFRKNITEVIKNPHLHQKFELEIKHENEGFKWCEVTLINLLADPLVEGIVCNFYDFTQRKISDEKIASSEKRFKALVQKGSDLICIMDKENNYTYVSETVTPVLGYNSYDLLGKNCFDFVHPDDTKTKKQQLDGLQIGDHLEIKPYRFKNANGHWRWMDTVLTNLLNEPSVKGIVSNSRDITDKINADAELVKLSLIAKNTNNAVIITDRNGMMTWVNDSFFTMTGFTFEEAIGKNPGKLLQGAESDEETKKMMGGLLRKGLGFNVEIINYRKHGEKYWVKIECQPILDEAGNTEKFFSIQTDITEKKENSQLLIASEERFRNLFEKTPACIIVWDPITFKILLVNQTTKLEYGYTENEFSLVTIHDLNQLDSVENSTDIIPKIISNKSFFNKGLRKHRTKNGSTIFMEFETHIIFFNGKNAILAVGQNVTEKLLLAEQVEEEKIKKVNQITEAVFNAQEKERAEIGRELHDNISQILAGSRLYLALAKKRGLEYREHLAETDKLIKEAINEIRNLSHSLTPQSLLEEDFLSALKELIKLTETGTGLLIEQDIANFKANNISDKMWLTIYRIIQEQLNNIVKYAKADSVLIKFSNVGNGTLLVIKDDGVGFNTSITSTGIGLMNIKTRAALHNGKVTIISSEGNGCELSVLFN